MTTTNKPDAAELAEQLRPACDGRGPGRVTTATRPALWI